MSNAKISSKGWVVIPIELRKKYRLESGKHVRVIDYGGVLALVPELNNPVEEGIGSLAHNSSLTKTLLKSRARERLREKKRR